MNNKKHIYLFLGLALLTYFVNAQENKLYTSITDSILKYSNTNSNKLIYFSKELQKSDNFCDQLAGINSEAKGFYQKKDYLSSEKIIQQVIDTDFKSLTTNEIICLKRKKITSYNRLFWIKNNQENYNKAYEYIVAAEKINESFLNKPSFYYRYKLNIEASKALIKSKLNLFNEAKNILVKTYEEIEKIDFTNDDELNSILLQKANISNSIANNYLTLSKEKQNSSYIDSADVYYKRAYEISKSFKPKHSDSEILYYLKETEVLIAKKKFQKAIDLINNYPNINKEYNYHHFQSFQKAICFYNLKNVDSTIYFCNQFLKLKTEKCKRSNLITIYDIISNQYNNLNKVDSAYKYSKLTLKEFNTAKINKEKTFQLLYNNDFKKIKELNTSIQKKESGNNQIIYILLISCIIPVLLFFIVFRRNKTETTENSEENNTPKKSYNIDASLEKEILQKLEKVENNLEFLSPDFSINKLAESLETNTSYVSYFFNKKKGKTFKQYYSNLKLNYLIEKLKSNKQYRNYTIEALGKEIGYTNPSAFTRAFKKHTNTTPSAFIKALEN